MAHIYVSSVIQAPVDEVWAIARDFTGHWHSSVIFNSSIEDGRPSDQVGCVRAFELSDYVATVRFVPITMTRATFGEWSVDFRVAPEDEESTVNTVRGVFENGFNDIAALLVAGP